MAFSVMSANLNGIRAANKKGFFQWFSTIRPEVLCVQETKAQMQQLNNPELYPKDYYHHFADAEKKGYSGVGIYSLEEPIQITQHLNHPIFDQEGRFIAAEFSNAIIVSLYLPSGTSGEIRQNVKYECMDFFFDHYLLPNLNHNKPIIICGDWNIAHQQRDLKNWRNNQKNSGFLPKERAWLDQCFNDLGWIDAFREVNQEDEQYTWWTYRAGARARNVGWRIDYQITTPNLKNLILNTRIDKDPIFSDHAPLTIEYDLPPL